MNCFNGSQVCEERGRGFLISWIHRSWNFKVVGKKIEVQQEQIVVDGVTKAKMPPGIKSIRAFSRSNEVVVEVDGKEVFKLGP